MRFSRAALLATLALTTPALAAAGVSALDRLERGAWVVKALEKGAAERSVCVSDPAALIQLEHGGGGCAQELVSSDARAATVQYQCAGRGFGHTTVRLQTPRAATIETQGLVDGRPFSYRAVARRTGAC